MKVSLIETKGDLLVVNAARCSFDKESQYEHLKDIQECVTDKEGHCIEKGHITLNKGDIKLINYLASHNHISPFFHPQEVFSLSMSDGNLLSFLLNANLSGFEWYVDDPILVRGSLYAWLTNLVYLPLHIQEPISNTLLSLYPVSYNALWKNSVAIPEYETTSRFSNLIVHNYPTWYQHNELCSYTLRIEAPIFVKRQLETHRRGFVMTDIEDFAQNEVSRRYVDTEPVIYQPKEWRMQSKDKKQGSSGEVTDSLGDVITNNAYQHNTQMAIRYYERMNERGIAHELSRAILPLATYTTWWFTGSMKAWNRLFSLRLKDDVQSETREVAQLCYDVIQEARVNH